MLRLFVITLTEMYHHHLISLAIRSPKVFTVHAVIQVTLAQRLATVLILVGSYIGVGTDQTWTSEQCCPRCRDTAIHSFSNVYHCGWNNGSNTGPWCCGAQEGTAEGDAGCCDTTFFHPESPAGFGVLFARATESNISATNTSPSSATQSISNSGPSNPVSCSPGVNLTVSQNAPISKPQKQSWVRVAIGLGVSIPLGMIASASLLLLFREHKLRHRAESAAGIINDKPFSSGERRERALHESQDHNARQELGKERTHPNELDSRQVHEVAVRGQY